MDHLQIHSERTQPALVHGARLPWLPSPEQGVERRMLERSGGEVALASSIVRYRAGSRFHTHEHVLGEEFLVLEGTFSDQHGHYPAGTYVRNPPGSAHAPFSDHGCVIFVKLRQMSSDESEQITILPADQVWSANKLSWHERAVLYGNGRIGVSLERVHPDIELPAHASAGGEEIFVVEGSVRLLCDDQPMLEAWSWFRHPGNKHPGLMSDTGALLWVKRGHLSASDFERDRETN